MLGYGMHNTHECTLQTFIQRVYVMNYWIKAVVKKNSIVLKLKKKKGEDGTYDYWCLWLGIWGGNRDHWRPGWGFGLRAEVGAYQHFGLARTGEDRSYV